MLGDPFGGVYALFEGSHAGARLQGILRRDQPPDLIKRKPAQRHQANVPVTAVRGIERTAQESHAAKTRTRRLLTIVRTIPIAPQRLAPPRA